MIRTTLAAIIFSLTPVATLAQEHDQYSYADGRIIQQQQIIIEQRTNPLVPILGAAILGGAIIYGVNQNNRSYHHHHEYHGRSRSYRRHGRNYRICRDHHRRYYC